MIPSTPLHKREDTARPGENPAVHPLLVFSPDPDVAKSLTMLLEENYAVETETDLSKLEEHINRLNPPIMLVDLYAFPADILKTVEVLKRRREKNPVILFHVYRTSRPEIEQAIRSVSDIVLYKPINTDLVAELTSVLMAVHNGERVRSSAR